MALIVETIVADSMAELRSRRDCETPADLVELRLDGVRDVDVAGALAGRRKPVIVTCRPAREGGRFEGGEEQRLSLLARAADLGAEYVDVEWQADRRGIHTRNGQTKLILSHHEFTGTPSDLADRARAMCGANADVVKIAVTPQRVADCVVLERSLRDAGPHVAIAMGPLGQFTRLWPAWSGSLWTYGGTAAPGQVSTRDLADTYRVRLTSASTQVYGVAGAPLGHSASPAMHNAAYAAIGRDAVYLPFETRCASEFFSLAAAVGLRGASVTIPLKQALLTSSVATDEIPVRIGALNTLRRGPSGWEGRNFDVAGFLAPLEERVVPLAGRRAVVLGAGGAARGVIWALTSQGARTEIAARRPEVARSLATIFGARSIEWPPEPGWDLLVNTTPVGMWPQVDESPLPGSALASAAGKVVYDLVYNPLETKLLRLAREAGATTIDGLEMLVGQACRQFEWWTSQPAPREVMAEAAREFVQALGQ